MTSLMHTWEGVLAREVAVGVATGIPQASVEEACPPTGVRKSPGDFTYCYNNWNQKHARIHCDDSEPARHYHAV